MMIENINDIKESINCNICYDIFVDPITLYCGHTFCEQCITYQDKLSQCPLCRKDFQFIQDFKHLEKEKLNSNILRHLEKYFNQQNIFEEKNLELESYLNHQIDYQKQIQQRLNYEIDQNIKIKSIYLRQINIPLTLKRLVIDQNFNYLTQIFKIKDKLKKNRQEQQSFEFEQKQLIKDQLICNICKDLLNCPVTLVSCGHTFCKNCLTQQLRKEMKCYTCGLYSIIVLGIGCDGFDDIHINVQIQNLIDHLFPNRQMKQNIQADEQAQQTEKTCTIKINDLPLFISDQFVQLGHEQRFVFYEERYRKLLQLAHEGNGYFGILPHSFVNDTQLKNSFCYLVKCCGNKKLKSNTKQYYTKVICKGKVSVEQAYIKKTDKEYYLTIQNFEKYHEDLWFARATYQKEILGKQDKTQILYYINQINKLLQKYFQITPNFASHQQIQFFKNLKQRFESMQSSISFCQNFNESSVEYLFQQNYQKILDFALFLYDHSCKLFIQQILTNSRKSTHIHFYKKA